MPVRSCFRPCLRFFGARYLRNITNKKRNDRPCAMRCRYFETFSYLPPLTDEDISKQIDYIVKNAYIPSLEFAMPENAYISSEATTRFGNVASNYFDNR